MFTPIVMPDFSHASTVDSLHRQSFDSGNTSVSRMFAPETYSSDSTQPILQTAIYVSKVIGDGVSTQYPVLLLSSERVPNDRSVLVMGRPSLGNNGGRHPGIGGRPGTAVGETVMLPGIVHL